MSYTVGKVEVWAADVLNRPGALARVLEGLTLAGAQLDFLIARRVTEHTSRIFVAPLRGKKQRQMAKEVGLIPAAGMHTIRIEGPDRAGLGAEVSRAVAAGGVNIRGASAATIGRKCVLYLAFQQDAEAKKAAQVVRKLLRGKARKQ